MDDPLFLAEIHAAVDRGVKVRVVKEDKPVGDACRVFDSVEAKDSSSCQAQKELVSYVQKSGGEYVPFNHTNLCGIAGTSCFEHGKIILVDGIQAFISTGNFNTSNLCNPSEHQTTCNRDYSVISRDSSVVSSLAQIFVNDLKGSAYAVKELMDGADFQKLTVSPYSLSPLISFIVGAKSKIQIQNQYLKDPDLNNALIEAAKRGVNVEVMVASVCSFGKPTETEITKWNSIYGSFDQAGIRSRIFSRAIKINGVGGYLHAKAIVVDGERAWVGSVNGSTTSLSDNREFGIFLTDRVEVKKLQFFMDQDFSNPNGETWEESAECKSDPSPSRPSDFQLH